MIHPLDIANVGHKVLIINANNKSVNNEQTGQVIIRIGMVGIIFD